MEERPMMRVVLFHLYVTIMAIFVVTTGTVLADHYGTRIVNTINGTVNSVNEDVSKVKNSVKDWNKKILE